MKINQKFAKKAMVAASLTAGVIGFNSIFNEAQATASELDNGRPLMSNGTSYCCQNNGSDCGAACC